MMGMFLALAAGAALSTTTPAEGALQSVSVPYADLDLATRAGRHALDRRIHAAAADICGIRDYDHQLPQLQDVMICATDITNDVHPVVATVIAQAVSSHASIMAASAIVGK
ncbi:MAG: UrcA family protein [Sphingomicrobium sp.]